MTYFIVFFYGLVLDAMYVLWLRCVNNDHKWWAALASVGVAAPGLMGYVSVSKDLMYALPYLLGLFVGTLLTMTLWSQRGSNDND